MNNDNNQSLSGNAAVCRCENNKLAVTRFDLEDERADESAVILNRETTTIRPYSALKAGVPRQHSALGNR